MREYQLGQALLVEPQVPFQDIAAAMQRLGWQRQDSGATGKPLIEGEPESASWWWHGRKPFVIYTFNPVAKLRVLDVATLPPAMRGGIASQLPLLDDSKLAALFDSHDPRKRLLALWAAQEIEQLDFISEADRLASDADPVVAEQARNVRDRLRQINETRFKALANLRLLTETAPGLIRQLTDPAFVQTLRPTPEDVVDLFDENLKPVLVSAADSLYSSQLKMPRLEPNASIEAFALTAGMLRSPNMLSEKFPLAYRDIAGWMNPRRVWLAWTVKTPAGGTVRYDGLAWLSGRWVWLPKVYRFIAPFLLQDTSEQ